MSDDSLSDIQLIAGLGNPGPDYVSTRHNVGQWFVAALAQKYSGSFQLDTKSKAHVCKVSIAGKSVRLLIPTVYMNESGQSVAALANFFKISPRQILVVHDELDLNPGIARLKQGGGHGGHNGLRDIMQKMANAKDFMRLRIGIGHPGHKNKVSNYVLKKPSADDQIAIEQSIEQALAVTEALMRGDVQNAMLQLHTQSN